MSLYDRDYSRASGRGGGGRGGEGGGWDGFARGAAGFLSFLNWSFPIGTYFDVRVRVHILFVLLVVFRIWPDAALLELGVSASEQVLWSLRWIALLFGSVMLHEFGHCFGCRAVGGQANEILMWPLGGLAFVAPPRRPWPEFVTVACGPLVNVVLAAASYLVLLAWLGPANLPVSLNPFEMWREGVFFQHSTGAQLLADAFVVNYALLLFNVLLIFYPFDGGRLVQIALWVKFGYGRSMSFACNFGMAGAAIVALVGIMQQSLFLTLIAVFGFITCYQQKRILRYADVAESEFGLTDNWRRGTIGSEEPRPGFFARRRAARDAQRLERERTQRKAAEAEVDRILQKVHDQGIASLSEREKRTLRQSSEKQQRE